MSAVQVKVTMQNGSGMGVFVKVNNSNLFFDKSGVQTLNLNPGSYVSTIGGHEPSSSNALIEFIENGNTIGQQTYSTSIFFGFIPFNVN